MGAAGRNERCGCGSGRKAKRCCGVQRGPSEADLARAFLASQVRSAGRVLRSCPDGELDDLLAEMIDLPCLDTSLQLPLPHSHHSFRPTAPTPDLLAERRFHSRRAQARGGGSTVDGAEEPVFVPPR